MQHLIINTDEGPAVPITHQPSGAFGFLVFYVTWAWEIVSECFFLGPLRNLYLKGYWQGRPLADICVQLAGARASHWMAATLECERIVDEKFMSLVWMAMGVIYFYLIYEAIRWLHFYIFYIRPFQKHRTKKRCQCGAPPTPHHALWQNSPRYLESSHTPRSSRSQEQTYHPASGRGTLRKSLSSLLALISRTGK